ncbi:MAG TPA: ankyrin repeat domain-containing protein [Caulobacteraceae bacterium]|nr:ankyrin repeat domain-containing protein [Caulobacteraceae bacterium]
MTSKTALTAAVKAFDWAAVDAGLAARPALAGVRDKRGRNWLHLTCATELKGRDPAASIRTADVVLARGVDLADHAFTEGAWKATPVWFCVSRGRNPALAEHILKRGADPNYALFAACWNDDVEAIDLLIRYGADVDDASVPGETPLQGAVGWSKWKGVDALARHGADVNRPNGKGQTPLHMMLKKDSPIEAFEMLAGHGARGDIAGPDGQTAAEIMARKKDPRFKALAARLAQPARPC